LNGTVEIPSGTTDVGQVFIQIGTVAQNGTITWSKENTALTSEFATLKTLVENGGGIKTKTDLDNTYYVEDSSGNKTSTVKYVADDWWGIPVNTKTATWNIALNSENNLNPTTGTTNIAVRACAINKEGKMGLWTDAKTTHPVYIHVDANAPGQTAVMRQYSTFSDTAMDSNISVQKDYSPEMYLKGKWYIVATLKDNDSLELKTLKVRRGSVNLVKHAAGVTSDFYYLSEKTWEYKDNSEPTIGEEPTADKEVKSVSQKVYIPVDTEALNVTAVSYSVYMEDTSHFASTMTYNFFIDNKPPVFDTLTGNDSSLLVNSNIPGIENSNYVYNLGGKLKEDGSGFSRIFFYFLRNNVSDSSNPRVLDAMVDYSTAGNDGRIETVTDRETNYESYFEAFTGALDTYTVTQGSSSFTMYGKTYAGNLGEDGKTFTSTAGSLEANKHIRKGGLIYIGGDYHKIKSVSGTAVTFEDEVSTIVENAGFPYGQVVDHTEKSDQDASTHHYNITGDDGDGMPESAITVSGTTTWEGTIYSDQMTDGPVTLVCIAFDKAGNVAEKRIATKIKNNAPRLAKLYLGTDLSGDGKYSGNEFNTYQFVSAEADGSYKDAHGNFKESVELATAGTNYSNYGKAFEIRSGLAVVPEITGGNGAIKLAYLKSASEKAAVTESSATVFRGTDTSSKITATFSPITNATSGKVDTVHKFILESTDFSGLSDGTGKGMSFTFWDSTDGTVCGSDSNNCYVYVTDFTLALNDSVVPKSVIDPFYWNGLKENSVYGSSSVTYASQLKGHIELESDWKETTAYANRGTDSELDGDPKVSGKITMTGYAYDNQRLSSLWIAFDGFTPAAYLSTGGDAAATANIVTAADGKYVNSGTNGDNETYYQVAYFTPSTGNWTKTTASMAANGWEFVLTDEKDASTETYLSQSGHKVKWTLSIDTEKCNPIAATDIKARIIAFDHKHNVVKVAGDGVITTTLTNTDGSDNVPLYQMDVVPYIQGVKTSLSKLNKSNSSVYDRTALGHYSLASTETAYFYGFNINGGTVYDKNGTNVTLGAPKTVSSTDADTKTWYTTNSTYTLCPTSVYGATISSLTSGEVYIKVGDVESLNNKNNNDSVGSYAKTNDSVIGNRSIYENFYNRQPNDSNNNRLTDDVVLDVWLINSNAAPTISGLVSQPVMKVNPLTGQLNFAFANGPLYFSMGSRIPNNDSTSYDYWTASYDFFTSVGYAVDKLGYGYGVASGGDINSNSADNFIFVTGRWGTGTRGQRGSMDGTKALRLEQVAQKIDGVNIYNKNRIMSPALATAVHGTTTNVYLAYYDDINSELRVKAGATNSITNKTEFGTFVDQYTYHESNGNAPVQEYSKENVTLLAGSDTGYTPGEYVSVAVKSKEEDSVDDVLVLVWYSNDGFLYYTYNDSPLEMTKAASGYTGSKKFVAPTPVFADSSVGEYCKIAVDKNGGIHVAAYDSINANVKYAYRSEYNNGSWQEYTVDSFGIIGSEITLDVAYDSVNGNPVPYIGYYASSAVRPKVAYLAKPEALADGANSDSYTGVWETSYVPTSSKVPEDHINVGVWKANGVITNGVTSSKNFSNQNEASPTGSGVITTGQNAEGTGYNSSSWGYTFGNGSQNPILGYQIRNGTTGSIETAQMQ
jgi:hypothetical protein